MKRSGHIAIDILVAAGLGLALLLVVGLDKVIPQKGKEEVPEPIVEEITEVVGEETVVEAKPLKMVMTPSTWTQKDGLWEDMSDLLKNLGEGYEKVDEIRRDQLFEFLTNLEWMKQYDIIFFTCGQEYNNQLRVRENLRAFVEQGGTLYASDWRYECIKYAFGEYHRPELEAEGLKGDVVAKVMDQGLRAEFGDHVTLKFELPQWKAAAFGDKPGSQEENVEWLLWGEFRRRILPNQFPRPSAMAKAPLLVRFHHGKGTVIFTSFHNEKHNSEIGRKLLKYMVFTVVTSKVKAKATKSMLKGGFSPSKSNLMSASAGNQSVSHTFDNKSKGKLRFVLSFNSHEKVKLKLVVTSPGGKKYVEQGRSTLTVDVPNAEEGEWRYTITALEVPYENYPFEMTVGTEKK